MSAQAILKRGAIVALTLMALVRPCLSGNQSLADAKECFSQLDPKRGLTISTAVMTDVKLTGTAHGGELVLISIMHTDPQFFRIETHRGESAETVLARLAAGLTEHAPFNPGQYWITFRAEGNLLKSLICDPGSYVFAGTETGLGIPPPPTSLTASHAADRQEVSLAWENPDEPYDAIGVFGSGFTAIHPGTTTSVTVKAWPPAKQAIQPHVTDLDAIRANKGFRRYYIVGCRDGVLSNAAAITWDYEDNSQQELDTHPFTAGISPNWKAWSHGREPGALVLEQGVRGPWKQFRSLSMGGPVDAEGKDYFQLLKTRSPGVVGGVYRKFLGLKPGHTYRLSVRMNTLAMDQVKDDWSFSFHAVPHDHGVTLTAEQMAGIAPLPDGSGDWQSRQTVAYTTGTSTQGKFAESTTGPSGGASQALDLTLPAGADTITAWFRYSGAVCSGVGFDWIKLKDVTVP